MTLDIESLNLSDDPIEGLEEAFDNWQEPPAFGAPPAAGPQRATFAIDTASSADGVLKFELTYTIVGGADDAKTIRFQRISSKMFERRDGTRTSQVIDLLMSAGVQQRPHSLKEVAQVMKSASEGGKIASFQHDWRGACMDCYKAKLRELTGTDNDDAAKVAATKAQRKEADKFAVKFKNFKAFPVGTSGERLIEVKCPVCGGDIRAQSNIVRFLAPGSVKIAEPTVGEGVPF